MNQNEKPEFITVANAGTKPRNIINALRDYADNHGGQLLEAVAEIDDYEPTQAQLDELMWVYHQHAPTGYRFTTKPGRHTNYGYELATRP